MYLKNKIHFSASTEMKPRMVVKMYESCSNACHSFVYQRILSTATRVNGRAPALNVKTNIHKTILVFSLLVL